MRNQEYFLGVNLCAGAVGWCVTDANYHILKQNRKSTIGSALFPAAETAGERRAIRCARRRLQRQHERIRNLQGLFAEEINKVDPGFFLRLKRAVMYGKIRKGWIVRGQSFRIRFLWTGITLTGNTTRNIRRFTI